MAVVQAYVEDYEKKVYFTGMEKLGYKINFEYCLAMAPADLQMFLDVGIVLRQPPSAIFKDSDAEVDFTESRLAHFNWREDHHVAQVYGALIGVESTVMPEIRKITPGEQWVCVKDVPGFPHLPRIDGDTLVRAQDGQIGGIIGRAGWETYLACAQGLPVIEIKPPGRPANALSKWSHKQYRMVDGEGNVVSQVQRALLDLKVLLQSEVVDK